MFAHNDDGLIFGALILDENPAKAPEGPKVLTGAVLDSAIDGFIDANARSGAMASALQWLEGGDSDENPDYESLECLAESACLGDVVFDDLNDDDDNPPPELSDEEFSETMHLIGDSLIELGGKPESVEALINTEDDEAAKAVVDQIETVFDSLEETDAEIISRYAVGGVIFDDAMKKVIRDNKPVFVKKKRRKKPRTAAQKAAMKAARRKAHTGAAKKKRKKSNNTREKRGMK